MELTQIHRQILLCTAYNLNKRIYNYGFANVINYSVLELIYEILDSNLDIDYEKIKLLELLAEKIQTTDPDICISRLEGPSFYSDSVEDTIIIGSSENNSPTVLDSSTDVNTEIYTFQTSVFTNGFSDPDGDNPKTVRIITLPSQVFIQWNGVDINAGFEFDINNISNLTFTRDILLNDTDSFTFQISDDNDNPLFSNVATASFLIEPVVRENQPATIGDQAIVVDNRVTTILTLEMFTSQLQPPYNDPENDLIDAIRINEISTANKGSYLFNNVEVTEGQIISREDLNGELFTHVGANQDDIYSDVIDFSARDEGSLIWVS